MQLLGGRLQVRKSIFEDNRALNGGAFFVSNVSRCWIAQSTFANNHATASGGAFYVMNGTVTLSNGTRVDGNTAAGEGRSVFLYSFAALYYALPAPIGRWVPNSVTCRRNSEAELCDAEQHAGYTVWMLRQTNNDLVLPYRCAPGLVGSSKDESTQVSPTCAGVCPPGTFCTAGAQQPAQW